MQMSIDPFEDAIRPMVQKLITETVKSPDSVTLKVYDDALDRVEKYLKRILIVCVTFLTIIGSILGWFGWSSYTQITKNFEESTKSTLSDIQLNNKKVLDTIEGQKQKIDSSSTDLSRLKEALEKQQAGLLKQQADLESKFKKQQADLQNKFETYFDKIRLVTKDISPQMKVKFRGHMKAFWDYGQEIGLFEHPFTDVQIEHAFTVNAAGNADFFISEDKGLLTVAIVSITSEPDLLQELILDRLGELNGHIKDFRETREKDLDDPATRNSHEQRRIAIYAISRGLSKFLFADFSSRSAARSNASVDTPSIGVPKDPEALAEQWAAVFREFDRRVRGHSGLEGFGTAKALVRVWKDLDVENATLDDAVKFSRRATQTAAAADSVNANNLIGVGNELVKYYEDKRSNLSNLVSPPVEGR
jgi:hypothetical protein